MLRSHDKNKKEEIERDKNQTEGIQKILIKMDESSKTATKTYWLQSRQTRHCWVCLPCLDMEIFKNRKTSTRSKIGSAVWCDVFWIAAVFDPLTNCKQKSDTTSIFTTKLPSQWSGSFAQAKSKILGVKSECYLDNFVLPSYPLFYHQVFSRITGIWKNNGYITGSEIALGKHNKST